MGKPSNTTAEERAQIVLAVLRRELTAVDAARRNGVSEQTIHNWRAAFVDGGRARLARRQRPPDVEAELRTRVDELTSTLGELRAQLRVLGGRPVTLPPSLTSR